MLPRQTNVAAIAGILVGLSACGSLVDEDVSAPGAAEWSAKGDNFAVDSNVPAICQVRVQGLPKNVEDDYLPHVLFCEVGLFTSYRSLQGRPVMELLQAQAIAARTFMHGRLALNGGRSLSGTTDDQVYSDNHCRGTVPQIFRQAVEATRGLVLLRSNGSGLHAGYYRAGRSFTCRRYNAVYGEPCMGQQEAAACARDGYSYKQILSTFYGSSRVVQTSGSCASGQGPIDDAESSACYFGAQRGTCQETSLSCNGHYAAGLCGGTAQCCLPPEPGEGDSCNIGGTTGTCQHIQFSSCQTGFKAGFCLAGGPNIQCCLDAAPIAPAPVEPTPVEPTPVEPTPVEPTPVEPTPVEPAPGSVEPTAPIAEQPAGTAPTMRWIGDPCTTDEECAVPGVWQQGVCSAGFCTASCDLYCPDLEEGPRLVTGPIGRLLRPATFCASIALNDTSMGFCYSRRDYTFYPNGGCPAGTTARLVGRTNQASFKRNICVPDQLLGGKGDGLEIGQAPTPDGDALDLKDGSGCSLSAAPATSLPWGLLLVLAFVLPRRRRAL